MAVWTNDAIEELKRLYIETDIPSDALIKDKNVLSEFTERLNLLRTDQDDFTSEEVASELLKVRKSGRLPRIRD